jgi:hypothetical protein
VRIDRRLLGWGLFLIIVGAIPLLVRGGYLDRGLIEDWPSLWPLLLIGWGIGLVLRRTPGELLGSAISVTVLGVMVGGLIATGFGGFPSFGACGDGTNATSFASRSGTLSDGGRVNVEFSCGTLTVEAVDGSDWSISGRGPDGEGPEIVADPGRVQIKPRDDEFRGFIDDSSTWDIGVPRTPRLDIGITLNAGDGKIDLAGADLGNLSTTLNAGSLDFKLAAATALGSVNGTVNAGSATFDLPGSVTDANLTLNAGSITVCLPAGTPVNVRWNGALGSNNFDSAGLAKIDDQHWMSGGLNPASDPHLELRVSANAGSFTLDRGGSCDA